MSFNGINFALMKIIYFSELLILLFGSTVKLLIVRYGKHIPCLVVKRTFFIQF